MDQDELAAIIAQAGDEGWTTLDLSGEGLEYLSPAIGNLTALTSLNLWNNQLTALPPEIGELTKLTELYLSNNQLAALPLEMAEQINKTITGRRVVNLSGNPP